MAQRDASFVETLPAREKKMLQLLKEVASADNTLNWIEKRKIQTLRDDKGQRYFGYVASGNRLLWVPYPEGRNSWVEFTSDPEPFDLKDGKPERTAVTERRQGGAILVNLRKINDPSQNLSLGFAVSLMLHETGRKLGKLEDEAAVDSLSAKIKEYVDSLVSSTDYGAGKIHVLKFQKSFFFDWARDILRFDEKYQFKNDGDPLSLFDREGLYIWNETVKGVQDLTEQTLRPLEAQEVVPYLGVHNKYTWGVLNWFLSDWIRVQPVGTDDFKISMSVRQLQLALPFGNSQSPDPGVANLYGRFTRPPFGASGLGLQWNFQNQNGVATLTDIQDQPLRMDDPSYHIELKLREWQNEDLVLHYQIRGRTSIEIEGVEGLQLKVSPDLVFEYGHEYFEVKGTRLGSEDSTLYEFRVSQLKKANAGKLKIVSVEMSAEKQNLAHLGLNTRVNTWLNQSEVIELEGSPQKDVPQLKSVTAGSTLKLIFKGPEKLRALELGVLVDLQNKFTTYDVSSNGIRYEVATVTRLSEGHLRWIRFHAGDLKQTVQNGDLHVEVQVDRSIELQHKSAYKPELPLDLLQKLSTRNEFVETEVEVQPRRALVGLRVLSQSLRVQEMPFKEPLFFFKSQSSHGTCEGAVRRD